MKLENRSTNFFLKLSGLGHGHELRRAFQCEMQSDIEMLYFPRVKHLPSRHEKLTSSGRYHHLLACPTLPKFVGRFDPQYPGFSSIYARYIQRTLFQFIIDFSPVVNILFSINTRHKYRFECDTSTIPCKSFPLV